MCKSLLMSLVGIGFLFQLSTVQAENTSGSSLLISETTYKNLPSREQKKYIREARKHYYEFETVLNKDMKFVESSYNKYQFAMALLMDKANAATQEVSCVIGGVYLKLDENRLCPVNANKCDGNAGKFQCSEIYGSICVRGSDRSIISKLCFEQSSNISEEQYLTFKDRFQQIYDNVCAKEKNLQELAQEHAAACHYLRVRMDILNKPLERNLRAELDACNESLSDIKEAKVTCDQELKICEDKLNSSLEVVADKNIFKSCKMTGGRINGRKLLDISNVQMFKNDPKMTKLLTGASSNIQSVTVSYENKDKACFEFTINKYARNYANFENYEFRDIDIETGDGYLRKCISAGIKNENGKLFVPALDSRRHNYIVFDQNCGFKLDRLKDIGGKSFKRGSASVEDSN